MFYLNASWFHFVLLGEPSVCLKLTGPFFFFFKLNICMILKVIFILKYLTNLICRDNNKQAIHKLISTKNVNTGALWFGLELVWNSLRKIYPEFCHCLQSGWVDDPLLKDEGSLQALSSQGFIENAHSFRLWFDSLKSLWNPCLNITFYAFRF